MIRDVFPDANEAVLAGLTAGAAALTPGSAVVYPLSGSGERFPFLAPSAHGFGIEGVHGDPARFGALCQGIAYVEKLAYDVLGSLGADISGPVSLTGGASGNGWWNQLRADVLGRPALVPASAQAAVGMAVLAAAAPGHLGATAEAMVALAAMVTPDPRRTADLRPGYERLVRALADRGWLPGATAHQVLDRTS